MSSATCPAEVDGGPPIAAGSVGRVPGPAASPLDGARRAALVGAKLAALAGDHGVRLTTETSGIGVGAVAMAGGAAWALVEGGDSRSTERALGPVLAWALRRGADSVRVLTDPHGAGVLARRALLFDWDIEVWELSGRDQRPAVPAEALVVAPFDRQCVAAWLELIEAAGAAPVVEHGVLAGEVAGLEVCRLVPGPDGDVLEVGIGAHDRETFQMLHGARPTLDALRDVVDHVAAHRAVGAPQHPLNQLARSRLLRARLLADPSPVGTGPLVAAEPPVVRTNVKDELPCAAVAADEPVLVTCSVGIDLDAVVFAADAAAMHGTERCLVAVPGRDAIEIQHRLAERVRVPTRVVAVSN